MWVEPPLGQDLLDQGVGHQARVDVDGLVGPAAAEREPAAGAGGASDRGPDVFGRDAMDALGVGQPGVEP